MVHKEGSPKIKVNKPPKIIPPRKCLTCGKEFVPSNYPQKYCCIKCRKSYREPVRVSPEPRRQGHHKIPYSPEELEWIEERNFKNMIFNFQDDLRLIKEGFLPQVLNFKTKRQLIECGIIVRKHQWTRRTQIHYYLTPKAEIELQKLGKCRNMTPNKDTELSGLAPDPGPHALRRVINTRGGEN